MVLKEKQINPNDLPKIIKKSGIFVPDEIADKYLWKILWIQIPSVNYNGFICDIYGNKIVERNKSGGETNKSLRPFIPIGYDDDYFYCCSVQGVNDNPELFKKELSEKDKKRLYFLKQNDNENALPNKDSYIHCDGIFKIDKKFLIDAIDKTHPFFTNTGKLNDIQKIKILQKIYDYFIDFIDYVGVYVNNLKELEINPITNSFKYVNNFTKKHNYIKINDEYKVYLNLYSIDYIGSKRLTIPKSPNNICVESNLEQVLNERNNTKLMEKNLHLIQKFLENDLFYSFLKIIHSKSKDEKINFYNELNKKDIHITNDVFYNNFDEKTKKPKIKEFDDFIKNKIKIENENRNKNTNTKEEKNNNFPKKKNVEKER